MKKSKECEILDELHRIREKMWSESKGLSIEERVNRDNLECEKILKRWGVALNKADYLLKAVK